MSTSRSAQGITFTYFAGENNSESHGPNCHACMNQLFLDDKLTEVQFVYANTPGGYIAFPIRTLVFLYGVETPFTVTSFTEDIVLTGCVMCTEKAARLPTQQTGNIVQEVDLNPVTRKRKSKESDASVIGPDEFDQAEKFSNPHDPTASNMKLAKRPVSNKDIRDPMITISDTEENDTGPSSAIKTEIVYSIVSQYPTIPIVNRNEQLMVPKVDVDSVPDETKVIDPYFPFLGGWKPKEVQDEMKCRTRKRKSKESDASVIGPDEFDQAEKFSNPHDPTASNMKLAKRPVSNKDIRDPVITISDTEENDAGPSSAIKTEIVYSIVSQYPTIPIANRNEQLMVPKIDVDSVRDETKVYDPIDFPFLRGRKRTGVQDEMKWHCVVNSVSDFRMTVNSNLLYFANIFSASIKPNIDFHCDDCNSDIKTSCGLAVVNHALSDSHLNAVYHNGFVFNQSDDYKRLLSICHQVSTEGIDFPFIQAKESHEVRDPIRKFRQIRNLPIMLSGDVLAAIANTHLSKTKIIYCHHCNEVFRSPYGAQLIWHFVSESHYANVRSKGLFYCKEEDLGRLKRMYTSASAAVKLNLV